MTIPLVLRSARYLAAEAQARILSPGDTAVDCTLGNGHDALSLAKLVGETGKLIGFDIQPEAVERTRQELAKEGLADRCELHCMGHEHILEVVREKVKCIVFNLGWLPGGDKSITTRWETTQIAIRGALDLLLPMGILTVCVYPGHAAGEEERVNLTTFFASLRPQEYNVLHQRFINAGSGAPECFIIQRQSAHEESNSMAAQIKEASL